MRKAMALILSVLVAFLTVSLHVNAITPTPGNHLASNYYDGLCTSSGGTQKFQNTADAIVAAAVLIDLTLIPALVRLAFHDCFVQGCDASVLLNSTAGNDAEKDGLPNKNSIRGFQVIDAVKAAMELTCPGIISCADILQEVARAAMRHLTHGEGISWNLRYGRRDGRISLATEANAQLPGPDFKYNQLVASFASKGFNPFELMILSGAHTFGFSQCRTLNKRLYNFTGQGGPNDTDPALDPAFAAGLKLLCPQGINSAVKLDYATPDTFDNQYYRNINDGKALFTSDNELRVNPLSPPLPANPMQNGFFKQKFEEAMVKMSEVQVKLYPAGEIRTLCAFRK